MIQASQTTGSSKSYIVMSRFQLDSELKRFLDLPPCQRLLSADNDVPVRILFAGTMYIAEAQKQKSSNPSQNRLY